MTKENTPESEWEKDMRFIIENSEYTDEVITHIKALLSSHNARLREKIEEMKIGEDEKVFEAGSGKDCYNEALDAVLEIIKGE